MQTPAIRYRFDDVEVDTAAHRVLKDGVALALEPKAFAVLECLLAQGGALVARDELLDAVWGHRHITPGALNRVVANLRKALGDEAGEPRYIETVHGLGYRFAGTFAASVVGVDPASDRNDAMAPTLENAPHRPSSDRARYPRWSWFALPLLIGIMALIRYGSPLSERALSKPSGTGRSLVVLPFTAESRDAELQAEAEGLSESLTDAFARRGNLRVAGRQSAVAITRMHAAPQKAAELLDVDLVLAGELRTGSDGVTLRAQLWQRGGKTPLWTDESTTPRAQLFRVVASLIDRVAVSLPPSPVTMQAEPASVPVQDLYWLGRHYWYQRTPDSLARALVYFQRAVQQDPRYALGYSGVADACMLLYEYGDMRLEDALSCAEEAIARGKQLAPNLADIHASEGLMLLDEGDVDAAVMAIEHALQIEPRLPNARLWYGDTLAYAGRVREARDVHTKAEAEDPLNPALQTYLGVDALLAGDEAGAMRHLQRAIELDADYVEPYWQIALQHQLHGRMAQAAAVFAKAGGMAAEADWTTLYESYTFLLLGDATGAARSLDAVRDMSTIDRLEARLWLYWLLGKAGDLQPEIAGQLAASPSIVSARRYNALLARAHLLGGDDATARAMYDRLFASRMERGDPFFRPWLADLGIGHFAAWIALRVDGDTVRAQAIEAYGRQLRRYREGGVAVPALTYQEALLAALRADEDGAQRLLDRALTEGWLDATALRRDPGWRRYRDSPWLVAAQRRIDERVAAERTLADRESTAMASGMGD